MNEYLTRREESVMALPGNHISALAALSVDLERTDAADFLLLSIRNWPVTLHLLKVMPKLTIPHPSMLSLLLLMLISLGCSAESTVWDGVYTAEQAARGRKIYMDHCALCHKQNLTGFNGRIKGMRFMEEWREDNLNSLFIQIRKGMPAENPSSLTDSEYLDALTYILEETAFRRAGTN